MRLQSTANINIGYMLCKYNYKSSFSNPSVMKTTTTFSESPPSNKSQKIFIWFI